MTRSKQNIAEESKAALTSKETEIKLTNVVRQLGRRTPQTYELYCEYMETRPPQVIANIAICLIHQTNYLLDQQIRTLKKEFLEHGGLRERMYEARQRHRRNPPRS